MIEKILKQSFGFDKFRSLQKEIITNILNKQDTFVLMPTGGGKSLCYQLPALKQAGITLVISPLIALMKDQVDALQSNGIKAEYINSSLNYEEIIKIQADAQAGNLKILYIAPERLGIPNFKTFLHSLNISLIAIDEAHCISQWGHEFRPDYRNLKFLKTEFSKTPIIALTATATPIVIQDIIKQLGLNNAKKFISSFNRENLMLSITNKRQAYDKLLTLLDKHKGESAIIYCFSRKETEKIADNLKMDGFKALAYHAGLPNDIRKRNQELFMKDEVSIIVATIAFGMGIDKSDIRLIVHYTFPKTLEGYYQEIGRAGRDGLKSDCVLFYSRGDVMKHKFFIDQITNSNEKNKANKKLNEIMSYCENLSCRRKQILNYFNENYTQANCKACDICLQPQTKFDATQITQKIISCILRTNSRFGTNYIIDILLGKKTKQITKNKHEELKTFGIVHSFTKEELKSIINSLCSISYIAKTKDQYPTLFVQQKGIAWLKGKKTLQLIKKQEDKFITKTQDTVNYDEVLFKKLKILRKKIADKQNVPPFVIFSDVSLREMSYYFPCNSQDFLNIEGVGEKKLEQFSKIFLEVITEHVQKHNLTPINITDRKKRKQSRAKRLISNSGDRYRQTQQMILQKISLADIAKQQGFKEETIINHIEKLLNAGEKIDIEHIKPEAKMFNKIKDAYLHCGGEKLRPIYEFLNEQYSYKDIRLVKLFL